MPRTWRQPEVSTIVQILPALESGGVEKGTLEIARALVAAGHNSLVISAGGRMVATLEREGSRHLTLPIGRKRPTTLRLATTLREIWEREHVDLVHVRSRMPAWVVWRAWKSLPAASRPRLVTTVHGFYSPGWYSSVMTRGERVICVSQAIRQYVRQHYPRVPEARLQVIHRGVDPADYPWGYTAPDDWNERFHQDLGITPGSREMVVLPGRLSRIKGHADFLDIIEHVRESHPNVLGLIVGGAGPHDRRRVDRLQRDIAARLPEHIKMLGNRDDLREIMSISGAVVSLTQIPESFGRTTLEALALGIPVVGYDHGGVGEQLARCHPAGRVPPLQPEKAAAVLSAVLSADARRIPHCAATSLETMQAETLNIYHSLIDAPMNPPDPEDHP